MSTKIEEQMIFIQLDYKTKEEVLTFLSEKLLEEGIVREGYPEAILEREKVYPTGLPSQGVGIAIPHADSKYVNNTSIALATLKNPVPFFSMENPEQEVSIQIVIMLAIKEPHGQIEMLQKVVSLIQDKDLTDKIVKTTEKSEILALLKNYL